MDLFFHQKERGEGAGLGGLVPHYESNEKRFNPEPLLV